MKCELKMEENEMSMKHKWNFNEEWKKCQWKKIYLNAVLMKNEWSDNERVNQT